MTRRRFDSINFSLARGSPSRIQYAKTKTSSLVSVELIFFYLHSYMKIFQAKRKSSILKPFPEGRVDFCGAKRRDERYILPYCFSLPRSFCLTAKSHRLTAVRSQLGLYGNPQTSTSSVRGTPTTGTPKTYFVRFGEPFFQSTGLTFTTSPALHYLSEGRLILHPFLRVAGNNCMAGRPIKKLTCAPPVVFRDIPEMKYHPMRVDFYYFIQNRNI